MKFAIAAVISLDGYHNVSPLITHPLLVLGPPRAGGVEV